MNLEELSGLLDQQPLLALTIAAILLAVLAGMLAGSNPRLGTALRNTAYLGLAAAGLLTVAQFAGHNTRSEAALWLDRTRPPTVEGGETVVTIRPDGHFWVEAQLNGVTTEFLIDTGATTTGISAAAARRAGISPRPDDTGRLLDTANGTIVARSAIAGVLRFGSIDARDLDLVIIPGTGDGETNVIGMNLLSRLKSWRVEDNRMILVP